MTEPGSADCLDALAAAMGVERSYHDGMGTLRHACDEAVVAVLRALGASLGHAGEAEAALGELRSIASGPTLPAVVCALSGQDTSQALPRLAGLASAGSLVLESGEEWALDLEQGVPLLPREIPTGYHRLELATPSGPASVLLLAAPARLPRAMRQRALFAPLYGMRRTGREDGPGARTALGRFATYSDLAALGRWFHALAASPGGPADACGNDEGRRASLVGTLPLLACFFEEPFEPSPYSPISRCFWSELYVEPSAPALRSGSDNSPGVPGQERRIDYRAAMKSRRAAIQAMLASDGAAARVAGALREDAELAAYATFRAATEHHAATWQHWPSPAREGTLREGLDYDADARDYHVLAQLLAREQMAAAARDSPAGLYLDLPLGCHAGGFDTWRYRAGFAFGLGVGAPPDAVFEGGQDWGFPPLHPGSSRDGGHALWRAALRHHLEHAALLRIDHVMGLHRLFVIPEGFTPSDGVYVQQNAEELWSVLAIEAERARDGRGAAVVGEDLGTVPDEVRAEMRRRGALRMHVVPFQCRPGQTPAVEEPPGDCLACLGTHDMDTFASWWDDPATPRQQISAWLGCEPGDSRAVLAALASWLGRSPAAVACLSLEDLWLERERQNRPGQPTGERNWQRPMALSFEEFSGNEGVRALLALLGGCGHGTEVAA